MIRYEYIKRLFDILFSLLILPIIAIIILFAGFFVWLEDKGPIFYLSKRVGKNGNIFCMYKLRSMYVNAPQIRLKDGSVYNSEKDPRITVIGGFLRKTSIDELPQIINVLKGDMSLIGPRPSTPYWLTICKEKHKEILKIVPVLLVITKLILEIP